MSTSSKVLKRRSLVELSQPLRVPDPLGEVEREDLKQLAEEILAGAREEADRIVAEARLHVGEWEEQARSEGHAAAREEALGEARAAIAGFVDAVTQGLAEPLQKARRLEAWLDWRELEVAARLGRVMAGQVLGTALDERPELWTGYLAKILDEIPDRPLTVHVPPDLAGKTETLARELAAIPQTVSVELDRGLAAGQFRLTAQTGLEIVAGIDTALDQMLDEVLYGV